MTTASESTPPPNCCRRTRRSWTPKQKARLIEQARGLLGRGFTFAAVCAELDLAPSALRKWMAPPRSRHGAFRAVEVIDTAQRQRISLVLPNGLGFEGLDVEAAIAMAERLS